MREIKFRGRCIKTGDWIYGSLISFDEQCKFIFTGHETASSSTFADLVRNKMVMVDPSSVGQYTGLKDKNGVEIYEGDVVSVQVHDSLDWNSITGKVVFLEGGWTVEDVGNFAIAFWSEVNEIEVIGNIYQNQELLEVNKNV